MTARNQFAGGRKSASRMATKGRVGLRKARIQGARLVAAPRRPVKMRNIETLAPQGADSRVGNRRRAVGAVIEKLNMKSVFRPIQRGGRSQAIRNHGRFVENRNLHQNMGQVRFVEDRCVKPLAEQQAGGLLENIDPDENQKAAADE